jgi:hypothetical protein
VRQRYRPADNDGPVEVLQVEQLSAARKSELTATIENEIQDQIQVLGIDTQLPMNSADFGFNNEFYSKVLPVVNINSDAEEEAQSSRSYQDVS